VLVDGIRPRKIIKANKFQVHHEHDGSFWGPKNIDTNFIKQKKIVKKKEPLKLDFSIFGRLFSYRTLLVIIIMVLIVGLSSVITKSYFFINNNYDFLKLFSSGRYLLLFQNNTEMRATGGFIGSYAVIEVKNGDLVDYEFNSNVLKKDNELAITNPVSAPDPILSFFIGEGKWGLRDSNWAIDYQSSAEQAAWFYEQEGGKPVDGVMAINATAFQNLLDITGPIDMPEYNTVINSDNFLDVTQYKIEKEYFDNPLNRVINEPKSILKDMMPRVITKLTEKNNYQKLSDFAKNELDNKQILLYFYDDNKEKIALDNNWAGEVKKSSGDYLYVVNSNLGGMKSSLKVKEDINLNSIVSDEKSIVNTLTITRTHTGDGEWPDHENVNYIRILVPYGSELISAKLDDVGCSNDVLVKKESGKSVFSIWMITKPRSSRILTLTYKIPLEISKDKYSVLVQKQPGNLGDNLSVSVNGQVQYNGILNKDIEIK